MSLINVTSCETCDSLGYVLVTLIGSSAVVSCFMEGLMGHGCNLTHCGHDHGYLC